MFLPSVLISLLCFRKSFMLWIFFSDPVLTEERFTRVFIV